MLKRYLLAPGPTPVPHEALLAMAAPVVHHRTPRFGEIFESTSRRAGELFGTKQPVLMLSCSGTGGMEAAVTNTLSPGDKVIVVVAGKFGERWAKIAESFDLSVVEVEAQWGSAVETAAVEQAMAEHPDARALFVQHSETSTTALHPVAELAALTRERDCLLVVDGITSVGVFDCPMDEMGIDVLVTGSQKGLMLPPGLALIALSEKAWSFQAKARLPRYYFDLAKQRAAAEKRGTAYTPPISLVLGLNSVFDVVEESGGWPEAYRRHDILSRATRAGVEAAGLCLLAPTCPSPAATGVWMPEGIDGGSFTKYLRDVMGVTIAGGQGKLAGRIFRIGHIGYADTFDVLTALAAVELALAKFGHSVEFGAGIAAAQSILAEMYEEPA
ncbi:MAG: aspartate aminotransferase-like enzyme [Hyphomicrobiaceae bacterium]|jgi:aspartate aminotransferase-like enzyme